MNCTYQNCGSTRYIKFGLVGYKIQNKHSNRKQRYKCLVCGRTYSVPQPEDDTRRSWERPEDTRRLVFEVYQYERPHGRPLSYRKLAELVNKRLPKGARTVSHSTVRNWLDQAEKNETEVPQQSAKQKPAPFAKEEAGDLT